MSVASLSDSRPCTASLCYVLFAYFCLVIIHMKGVLVLGIYSYRCYRHIIYVYIYIYRHTYIYIHVTNVYIYIYLFIQLAHIYTTHMYTCVCARSCMWFTRLQFYLHRWQFCEHCIGILCHTYTHTHTQTHTHTHIHIYIYIYTYIYT